VRCSAVSNALPGAIAREAKDPRPPPFMSSRLSALERIQSRAESPARLPAPFVQTTLASRTALTESNTADVVIHIGTVARLDLGACAALNSRWFAPARTI